MESKKITCDVGGNQWSFETGQLAQQANGAVLARLGDTIVLATTVLRLLTLVL